MEETSVKSSKATQKRLELDVSTATPEYIKVYSKRYISHRTKNDLVVRKTESAFFNKPIDSRSQRVGHKREQTCAAGTKRE